MAYQFVERSVCPVCASEKPWTVFSCRFDEGAVGDLVREHYPVNPALLADAPYELMRCPDCTLLFQRFVGDDALLGELYGEWINDANLPERDPQYQAEVARPLQSRDGHEILTAATYLNIPPERMVVLDFGMGWGLWARIARQLGCTSYGHELSPDRVAYASSHGIRTVSGDELGTPRFDFINTEQVMEHLRDLRPLALKLAASLRPGGILKLSIPSGERAERVVEALRAGRRLTVEQLNPVHPLEHVNCFTRRALDALARTCRLEIVRPSLAQRYAFLATRGTLSLTDVAKTAKELVRPVYQYWRADNLYIWMRKPLRSSA